MTKDSNPFEIDLSLEPQSLEIEPTSSLEGGNELDASIDSMEMDIDITVASDENIIDSYLSSLGASTDVSLTDKVIEQTQRDDEQTKILGAALNLDVKTGDTFSQNKMVRDAIEQQPVELSDGDFDETTSKPKVSTNFSANDLRNLATLRASSFSRYDAQDKKRELNSINGTLRLLVKEERTLTEELIKLTEATKAVQENFVELSQAEDMLRNWSDPTKRNLQLLERLSKKGIGKMDIPSEKAKADEERQRCLLQYDRIQKRKVELKEELKNCLSRRQQISMDIEKVLDNVDIDEALKYVTEKCAKITGIDFGLKYYSSKFKEIPVYLECQCGCINKRDVDVLPVYFASPVADYREIRNKMSEHEKTRAERTSVAGITFNPEEKSKFRCDDCGKILSYTPSVIQAFTDRAFLQEVHSIDTFFKDNGHRREIPEGSSSVKICMGSSCFPDSFIKKLGITAYYESKTRTISANPYEGTVANQISDDDERVVKILNPNVDEDMLGVMLKSHKNHVKGINAYLDDLLENYLQIRANAEKQKAIEKNMLVSAMRKLIINNRWLIISYCVLQQVSVSALQDKINKAFKTPETVRALRKEFLRFFVGHIIKSIANGEDIVLIDADRKTNLITGKKTKLPHQYFFRYYRSLISFYFQIRTKTVNAQRELELLTEVLNGYNTIPDIEDENLAFLESEKLVAKIIKDLNSLIDNELKDNHNVLVSVNSNREKLAHKLLEKLNTGGSLVDSNGEVFSWVKYEIEKNLEIGDSHPYNIYNYNLLYGHE